MLKKRVITGLWGIPLLSACVWFSRPEYPFPLFTVLVAIWGVLAVFEFYKLVAGTGAKPLTYFGLVWTLFFIISPHFIPNPHFSDDFVLSPHFSYDFLAPLLLTLAVILPLLWLLGRQKKEGAFLGWAWTIAGIVYVGWLLSYLVALRGIKLPGIEEAGRNFVFFALFTTFASDTAAFFVGRAWGKHKLAPKISPGKTWEGTVAGVFGAIIVSLLFTLLLPIGYWQAIVLGIVVSIFGQLSDLVESLFKRNMGVKDSSHLIPGHGGFLDRIDSVVFVGVVVYYYVIWAV
jgi:phosphatidate cytidylyltransferase